MQIKRKENRADDELRKINIELNPNIHADGSCIISVGNTKILCTAVFEEGVPRFLKGTKKGWVTAEYGMLPCATGDRNDRKRVMDSGRTKEIQRLISRAMRSCVDTTKLGSNQIKIDCDVLQADGGTRCASITGAMIALSLCVKKIMSDGKIDKNPILFNISAVSAGIFNGREILDLDYIEDSNAEVDMNFVINDKKEIIEVQGTAEGITFTKKQLDNMYDIGLSGCLELIKKQKEVLGD